jgi:hypothetical protein
MEEMDDDFLIFTLSRLSISQREPTDNARKQLEIEQSTYTLANILNTARYCI